MKLGLIHYSNSYPFALALERARLANVSLHSHIPSRLNAMLHKGDLDVSAISSYEYLQHHEQYHLLPHWCINSKGAVKSVLLFSKVPIQELHGKNIVLSSHSATSANLLRLVLDHMGIQNLNYETQITPANHKRQDSHEWRKPQQGHQQQDSTHHQGSDSLNSESSLAKDQLDHASAILLIGDPALKFQDPNFPHVLDLAEAWQEQHQCPIVFAVQAVRREAWPTCKKEIEQVISTLRQVSERLKQQGLGQDLGSIRKAFPDLNEDFEAYFKCLDFDFNHECQLGLQRYATQLQKLGRLPQDSNLLSQLSPLDI